MTLTVPSTGQWAGSHLSIDNLTGGWMAHTRGASTANAWGTANRAIYMPIRVPRRVIVRELGYASSTTGAGNIDIGLYDQSGTRLISTGSTAKSATAALEAIDVTDTTIGPGLYYIGLNNSTTTDTFISVSTGTEQAAIQGVLIQAVGAVTLPATATWSIDHALEFIPIVSALLVTEVS